MKSESQEIQRPIVYVYCRILIYKEVFKWNKGHTKICATDGRYRDVNLDVKKYFVKELCDFLYKYCNKQET